VGERFFDMRDEKPRECCSSQLAKKLAPL